MSRQKHHTPPPGGVSHADPKTSPSPLSNLGGRKQGGRPKEGLNTHSAFSRSQMPSGY